MKKESSESEATVLAGDILAGKVTPKGETELTAEDRLLRAIFGEKAHDVKDSSLRLPRGSGGKVIKVQILDRSEGDDLPTGVLKRVIVESRANASSRSRRQNGRSPWE